MITRWSTAPGVIHVAVFENKSQGVGSAAHVTVDTFHKGELARTESGPLEKLARSLLERYKLTQATLALNTLEPFDAALFDAVVNGLWPFHIASTRQTPQAA